MAAPPRRPPTPPARTGTHQVNFRLPTDVWMQLTAAAGVLNLTQARIIGDALTCYFEAMPPAKRRVIDEAIALRKKHT